MFLKFVSTETAILLTRLQTDVVLYEHWKALARTTVERQPQYEIALGNIADALREWLYTQVPSTEGLAGTLLTCSLERMNLYEVALEILSDNSPPVADKHALAPAHDSPDSVKRAAAFLRTRVNVLLQA